MMCFIIISIAAILACSLSSKNERIRHPRAKGPGLDGRHPDRSDGPPGSLRMLDYVLCCKNRYSVVKATGVETLTG